jgi:branched-subunit amino acid aminotransferase/4-amino-4-deoxychorismate lyase
VLPVGERFSWTSTGGLVTEPGNTATDAALVVDSWLVADGRVRGLALHEQRFLESCRELVPELGPDIVRPYLAAVRNTLPAAGNWFPRLEAHMTPRPRLAFWLRPAPALRTTTALWVPPEPDPRNHPRVKGPDMPALASLREQALSAGADDVVLYAADGTVLEAGHSSILWWRGDTLCLPLPGSPVLPSVTVQLLLGVAASRGTPIRYERCQLSDLSGLEVWTVNALHGIRSVTGWSGGGSLGSGPSDAPDHQVNSEAAASRAARWCASLERLAVNSLHRHHRTTRRHLKPTI